MGTGLPARLGSGLTAGLGKAAFSSVEPDKENRGLAVRSKTDGDEAALFTEDLGKDGSSRSSRARSSPAVAPRVVRAHLPLCAGGGLASLEGREACVC